MAKGFVGGGDPNIQDSEFYTFENRKYPVTGIRRWISVDEDENDLPVFRANKFGGLQARMELTLDESDPDYSKTDGQGPPYSATRPQIVALVKAFGGSYTELPAGETSSFLLAAKKAIDNARSRILMAQVSNSGWVSYVEGARPDARMYAFAYIGAKNIEDTDAPLSFQTVERKFKNGTSRREVVRVMFKITGNPNGRASEFDDFVVSIEMDNPFNAPEEGDDGVMRLVLKTGKAGGQPISVTRFMNFLKVFAPAVLEHDWTADPTKSKFGVNEYEFPMVVVDEYARKAKRIGYGMLQYTEGGYPRLPLENFGEAGYDEPVPFATEDVKEEGADSPVELINFADFLMHLAKITDPKTDELFKDKTFGLTRTGVDWMKAHVVPFWGEGYPETRKLELLNKEQIYELEKKLRNKFPGIERGVTQGNLAMSLAEEVENDF